MKGNVLILENEIELVKEFSGFLAAKVKEVTDNGRFFSLAISGGSTSLALFEYLASTNQSGIEWEFVKLFWTNENCVPVSDHSNNYGSSKLLLLDKIPLLKFNIFRINGEVDPVVESERYSTILQLELPVENGLPCFDFIILDVGEDGHTAGIYKDNLDLFNTNKLTSQTFNSNRGITNITITGSVINNAKEVAFIASGDRRAGVIAKILNDTEVSMQYPAANVKPKSEMLYWFLDRDSSSYFNFE